MLDALARAAGELYTRAVVSFWRTAREKNVWLKPSDMMRWHTSDHLHAHSADAVVQSFYAALKSWQRRRKTPSSPPVLPGSMEVLCHPSTGWFPCAFQWTWQCAASSALVLGHAYVG